MMNFNIQKLMKQAQQMQAGLSDAQARLAEQTLTTESAGGKIKVTATGAGMITDLQIDPSILDPEDAEFVQSLILKAVQESLEAAKEMAQKEMKKLTGGLGFPAGFGL